MGHIDTGAVTTCRSCPGCIRFYLLFFLSSWSRNENESSDLIVAMERHALPNHCKDCTYYFQIYSVLSHWKLACEILRVKELKGFRVKGDVRKGSSWFRKCKINVLLYCNFQNCTDYAYFSPCYMVPKVLNFCKLWWSNTGSGGRESYSPLHMCWGCVWEGLAVFH